MVVEIWKIADGRWVDSGLGNLATADGEMLASPDGAASLSPLQGLKGIYSRSRGFAPGLAISAPLGRGLRAKEGVFKLNL